MFAAIERWPDRMDLWDAWEQIYIDLERPDAREAARAFYDAHRKAMHVGAVLLWPEEEDLYTLMLRMRVEGEGGPLSTREKQNVPINPEMCEWPGGSYFGDWLWFDLAMGLVMCKSGARGARPKQGKPDAGQRDYSRGFRAFAPPSIAKGCFI